MAALIEARGIVNRFGRQVVHDGLDLEIEAGEVFGIVGGSGSGKSVLLRTMLGLQKPVSSRTAPCSPSSGATASCSSAARCSPR